MDITIWVTIFVEIMISAFYFYKKEEKEIMVMWILPGSHSMAYL